MSCMLKFTAGAEVESPHVQRMQLMASVLEA